MTNRPHLLSDKASERKFDEHMSNVRLILSIACSAPARLGTPCSRHDDVESIWDAAPRKRYGRCVQSSRDVFQPCKTNACEPCNKCRLLSSEDSAATPFKLRPPPAAAALTQCMPKSLQSIKSLLLKKRSWNSLAPAAQQFVKHLYELSNSRRRVSSLQDLYNKAQDSDNEAASQFCYSILTLYEEQKQIEAAFCTWLQGDLTELLQVRTRFVAPPLCCSCEAHNEQLTIQWQILI